MCHKLRDLFVILLGLFSWNSVLKITECQCWIGISRKPNSIVPGLSIVGISWGALTAGLMLTSKSTRNMLNAKYALRADSKIASHPISWLTSAALHASAIHFLANSICGWSIARDMRTVDAVEMFLLGCLWCGCLQTFWGLLRPTMAIGSSGMGSLWNLYN